MTFFPLYIQVIYNLRYIHSSTERTKISENLVVIFNYPVFQCSQEFGGKPVFTPESTFKPAGQKLFRKKDIKINFVHKT